MSEKTFIRITNQKIYDIIKKQGEKQEVQHGEVIQRLDKTNGKVKLNTWKSTIAISLVLMVIGWVVLG